MSTDERYAAETLRLVADLSSWEDPWAGAADILNALADAGLLLPPGGEKTTQVGHWSANRAYLYECGGHSDECPRPVGGTFVETRWPDGSRHITGWTEVDG